MKSHKLIATLLVLNCTLVSASAANVSGTCGESAFWSYDPQTATLTISGTGTMSSFGQITSGADGSVNITDEAPWKPYVGSIRSIIIGEGITSIGQSAFSNCYSLENLQLPSTLVLVENYAFSRCGSLDRIVIPASVIYIGCNAFLGRYEETKPYIYFLGDTPTVKSAGGLRPCLKKEKIWIK